MNYYFVHRGMAYVHVVARLLRQADAAAKADIVFEASNLRVAG